MFKKNMRIDRAIELYEEGMLTIERAAEIAGLTLPEFKEVLNERGK